ncbi:MAG: hypothetical protein AUJ52_02315 [Elusimicrobia bacterium CG1_02_63_36]|nr:MAG: hypothetical protein AUJ52_02315 [Elusimicrobia bacterium CG1_02_63_36]PIP83707.1 MAG: hypothetical protein COR54_07945 [Elusimicrobia bacterium CG22_combo_CG10-13_8_21_14_all_63_91]PJA13623.1 MAG: hypothetical protein COX66_14390 [Elusimicrobia bacterium CG_4_10_14_0_2_um_filter_63_34]PJB26220.1 MAG: hypothetical protein CO113_04490 [Elusimicrobia bacterium CG_4_9_14_3_um_filter_62_55]
MPLGLPDRKEHLWFVLTDPDLEKNFLAVNLTSFELFKDDTVVLTAGHPFISKKSVIQYSDARLFKTTDLDWMIDAAYAQAREACSPELLKRIREGLIISDHAPQEMQEYLQRRIL